MAYISLYRKWRPQSFAELVGQEHVARTLTNAIKSDRVAHAYLFTGPRGTGKTSTAKILAKAVNCVKGATPEPCQECDNCLRITEGSSLDVLEIDAASNRGIDEIRDLREKVHFMPGSGPKKVYIIDEVHMLTTEAFNALLKLLEEPPAHVIFVLATTEPSKVLPTIISRCQRFDFRRVPFTDMVKHVNSVAKAEKIKIEDMAVELIAKQAQGGLRDALGMLDQLASYTGKDVKTDDVVGLLGLIGSGKLFEAVDLIADGAAGEIFSFANGLTVEGRDIRQFTKELIEHGRNLFVIQNGGSDELINATSEEIARLRDQAEKLSTTQVRRLIDILAQALGDMKTEGNPQFVFELAALRIMSPEADSGTEALLERLERLERQLVPAADQVSGKAPSPKIATKDKADPPLAAHDTEPTVARQTKASVTDQPSGGMSLRELERFWPTIMAKIKQKSLSTHAILIECRPKAVKGDKLVIAIAADWQQNLLEKSSNLSVIKLAIKNIIQMDLELAYELEAPEVEKNDKPGATKPANPAFDTGTEKEPIVPNGIDLLRENFGADIVGETE